MESPKDTLFTFGVAIGFGNHTEFYDLVLYLLLIGPIAWLEDGLLDKCPK